MNARLLTLSLPLFISILCSWYPSEAWAQVAADSTLPENSLVSQKGSLVRVDGGTTVGSNLFHSFSEFSIPPGLEVKFENPSTIERAIVRVTGTSPSAIEGVLEVNGRADLFFINPNGIEFGTDAALRVGGSFIGSTADSITFADGNQFSAVNPAASILTVSVPAGLQMNASAPIAVEGMGSNAEFDLALGLTPNTNPGLQVPNGLSLILVGGEIAAEQGILIAPGGTVELGGVSSGRVTLIFQAPGWTASYENVSEFSDISLSDRTLLDASRDSSSPANGGRIHLQGADVTLAEESALIIRQSGTGSSQGITVNASGDLEILGTVRADPSQPFFTPSPYPLTGILVENLGEDRSGDIVLSSQNLLLEAGAVMLADLRSQGDGGDIEITASETARLQGLDDTPNLTFILIRVLDRGNAGDVRISAEQFIAQKGGAVGSQTLSGFATGRPGNLTIEASESVALQGRTTPNGFPAQLSISDGGSDASSEGSSSPVLTVNTRSLVVSEGGNISSETLNQRAAGNIIITASEEVVVEGKFIGGILGEAPSQITASAELFPPEVRAPFGLPPSPSGFSGDIAIDTPMLRTLDGGRISALNEGEGDGGTIAIRADRIELDDGTNNALSDEDRGGLLAFTASGQGGQIDLDVDTLILRGGAQISASAGMAGDGGNIEADTDLIVGFPGENSDIEASAEGGTGGNIDLSAAGIFGLENRDRDTSFSDITVSSDFGVDGIVDINTPDVDPGETLAILPVNPFEESDRIVLGCSPAAASLTIVGKGGLPADPTAPLEAQTLWQDQRDHLAGVPSTSVEAAPSEPQEPIAEPLVEARGWEYNEEGKLMLVANPKPARSGVAIAFPNCQELAQ